MATITLQTVAGTTMTKTKTVSTADLTRLLTALKALYGANLTNAEVFDLWSEDVFRAMKATVHGVDVTSVTATAIAGITDIAFT